MPELPEVQTVVTQLQKKLVGHTILHFATTWPKKVQMPLAELLPKIVGAKVLRVERLGKHIVIYVSTDYAIVVHLKMTGHLLYKTPKNRLAERFTQDPVNGYLHHVFTLDRDATLEMSDMRKFGWINVVSTEAVRKLKSIAILGVDASSQEFSEEVFRELCLRNKRKNIAAFLLEQDKISGIGNIYRSEALYRAGVRPSRRVGTLSVVERKRLHQSIQEVLLEAVVLRGTTDGDFRDTDGRPGGFQDTLFVYGRHLKPCKKCGTMIVRSRIGARSAFFCPKCQV